MTSSEKVAPPPASTASVDVIGNLTIVGVRHHSPACAGLVREAIERLRPAHVLIEGPSDMNDRIGEFLLGHELPVAVFTSVRDGSLARGSWSPFCEYSPEWVALTEGTQAGAEVRFIDLPAWHPAFSVLTNRYADAELRYTQVVDELCRQFGMDNIDTLWDHMAEIEASEVPSAELGERLNTYFDLVRSASDADREPGDQADRDPGDQGEPTSDEIREQYMARWIAAALRKSPDRPVLVVCGGFHRPALLRLAGECEDAGWPKLDPIPVDSAVSYLVPYSFKRLDAFDGYQSGMPSPGYYQRLWELGPRAAAAALTEEVVHRLRGRSQRVSTADLIAARVNGEGLAAVRGHRHPARADLLDGLVSALVGEALDQPLPWTGRRLLAPGTHPAVVEMVAALSGDRVGRLHKDTPLPPLVHDAEAELERHGLTDKNSVTLDLTVVAERDTSRLLHRLRVLGIPGYRRVSGPDPAAEDSTFTEEWRITAEQDRLAALIEAGGYGPTVELAATARLGERVQGGGNLDAAAKALFDAVLCGIEDWSREVLGSLALSVGAGSDPEPLGEVLAAVLGLWRHDQLLDAQQSETLGIVIGAAVDRLLWLVESAPGSPGAPAAPRRIAAVRSVRDAVRHAAARLGLDAVRALEVMARIADNTEAGPDLRGAAFGFGWSLGTPPSDAERTIRAAGNPASLGDWLGGLFALAREQCLEEASVLTVLDDLVTAMTDRDLLVALPALRQAFAYFPPRERETIAGQVLRLYGVEDSARSLVRGKLDDPLALARGRELDSHVQAVLEREGLVW
ncbi:DUF5682 family protein [Catenulispora rubra]|uniref:DUF5682 family protein n=1 Tax=Catenulispora rubra TaxID=280293 RepID=UPI001E2CF30E|nr:DUF5682 family protein [Catenulispora rubra]